MNIIITEAQYNSLTEERLREFLYSLWDNQKKHGEEPTFDDIIYQVSDIKKNSNEDYEIIRPIWYDYNGGYDKLLQEIKDVVEHDEIQIKGESNLDIIIFVTDVISYGVKYEAGIIEINCKVVGGKVDGYVYHDETGEQTLVPNMDIFEMFRELEYDTEYFEEFIKSEIYDYMYERLKHFGVPMGVNLEF